jgi:hypothetical protein
MEVLGCNTLTTVMQGDARGITMNYTPQILGLLCGLWATSLLASPVDDMRSRYPSATLQVSTNDQAQPQGLFHLRGPVAVDLAPAALRAGASQSRDPALAKAQQFFNDNPDFFAAGANELRLHKRTTDAFGNQHLRFHRLLAGIPVADMEVLVHLNPAGDISGVNGQIVRPSEALLAHMARGATPAFGKLDALNRVAQLRNTDINGLRLLSAELVLTNEAPHLRWHLDINQTRSTGRFSYWLDAESGALIDVQNTLRHPIPLNR